ncbi:hypothetical protein GCM10009630_14670 [Kribbella jejuensis]
MRVQGGVQLEGLADRQLGLQLALLELRTEHLRERRMVGHRIQPSDPNLATVRNPQPLDAFDRGGLPGAVRPENPENLTFVDAERNIVDNSPPAVRLPQAGNLNNPHTDELRGMGIAPTSSDELVPGSSDRLIPGYDYFA